MTLTLALLLIGFTAATAGNAADSEKSELVDPATIPVLKERDERLSEGPSLQAVEGTLDEDFHFFGSPQQKQAIWWKSTTAPSEFVERSQLLPRRPGGPRSPQQGQTRQQRPTRCPRPTRRPTSTTQPTPTGRPTSTTQPRPTRCPRPTGRPTSTTRPRPTSSSTQSPTPTTNPVSSINSAQCGLQTISRGLQMATPQVKTFLGRIVGGSEVAPHSIPWQVLVLNTVGPSAYQCGGSLITDQWVLTSASCVHQFYPDIPISVRVRFGVHDQLMNSTQGYTPQTIVQHAAYDPRFPEYRRFPNDVALLKLPSAINFTNSINSVCLARVKPAPGTLCTITGWGRTAYRGSVSSVLLEVQVQVLADSKCKYGKWLPGMLCAGFLPGGKGPCKGDSGGPLACLQSGRWTEVGVVSFSSWCGRGKLSEVYADVSYYNSWIQRTIASNR